MEILGDLLFELSSEERMTILNNLQEEPLKLSHLAQKHSMTVTEASRQLQRLSDAELISKDVEGFYKITHYGRLILQLLPSLGFVSENRKYFQEHDTSAIPPEFISRFGELSNYIFNEDTISNLLHHMKILSESEEFCWTAANQFHLGTPPLVPEALKRGVDLRTIIPTDLVLPPDFRPAEGVQRRTLPGFNLVVIVSDKEAVIGLPYLNGKMDHAQYFSMDPDFIKWCKDLFFYYWTKAKPLLSNFSNTLDNI
jgi:predicted transcriptional regulator